MNIFVYGIMQLISKRWCRLSMSPYRGYGCH